MNHENLASADRPSPGDFELPAEFETQVVAEAAPGPLEPPKVVIEYRTKGLPWPLVLPLLLLFSLAAVAIYHRLSRWSSTHPIVGSAVNPRDGVTVRADSKHEIEPIPPSIASEPLSLSSQRIVESSDPPRPIGPGEFIGPPVIDFRDMNSALVSLPFPTQLLDKIPQPQLAEFPPPTLQAAMILATPAQSPHMPKPVSESAPDPQRKEPESEQTASTSVETSAAAATPADRVAPPLPEPLPTREKVLADIQQESEQKQAERSELKQFKNQSFELARQEAAAEVQEQRAKFVAELRNLIREKKSKAGVEIGQLHLRYNENVDPKLEYELRRLLKGFSGRTSIRTKIKALRAIGLPEPRILEIAVKEVHRREHSGRCDRFEPEMYVLAARELIATDLASRTKLGTNQETAANLRGDIPAAAPTNPASTGNRSVPRTQ